MPSPFDPMARGSYDLARTSDLEGSEVATLAAGDELPLSPEELAFDDPLDEKANAHFELDPLTSRPGPRSWTAYAQRLRWWQPRRRSTAAMAHAVEEEGWEGAGLLDNKWGSRFRSATTATPWLLWPLPSWSHGWFGCSRPEEARRPTDYLDGLRGVASLFVFFDHYMLAGLADIVNYSYGADDNWSILQLPFIRTVYSGGAMVSIFFVISGYVLSARCIAAARAGKYEKAYSTITSMTFRRVMRLYIPSVAGSSLNLFATFIGLRRTFWPNHWTVWSELQHYGLYLNQELFRIWHWDEELNRLGTPEWNGWYAGQLWTIPREFNCSMILFLLLIGTMKCTTPVRFSIEAALMAYLLWEGRWDVATFVAGMATAELNIIMDESRERHRLRRGDVGVANANEETKPRSLHWVLQLPFWAALIFGWYLTGMPYLDHERTPGYAFLTEYWRDNPTYKYRFWLATAGILVTTSVSFLPAAQKLFTTPIARYLGKVSYALYLVHAFMNSTFRWYIFAMFNLMKSTDRHAHAFPLSWTWFFATCFYVPLVLWVADIFWRLVDAPAVKFARWVEKKCFVTEEK